MSTPFNVNGRSVEVMARGDTPLFDRNRAVASAVARMRAEPHT